MKSPRQSPGERERQCLADFSRSCEGCEYIKAVKHRGGLCLKWVCPGWAGVPDRIVLLPRGRIIFVELKRPRGGVLSSRQVWWRRKLRALGFPHYVIWEHPDLDAFDAREL